MEEQALSCPICIKLYDSRDHEPHFIPFCGHSLCLKCLKNILHENQDSCKCPLCNKGFQYPEAGLSIFPKNYAILDLVDTKVPREFCPIHKSQLELICFECKCKVCNKCVFKGVHRDHEVDLLENFNMDLESKVKDINDSLAKNEPYFSAIESLINVKKDNLLAGVDIMHNNYVQFLIQKRDAVKKQIETRFHEILKKGALGYRKNLKEHIHNWFEVNHLGSGFLLKDESIQNIKDYSNPYESKELIQEALVYQVAFEKGLDQKLQNLYVLQEKNKGAIEMESQNKNYGSLENVLYEYSQKNLYISLKNQDMYELAALKDQIVNLPIPEVENCLIELESVKLARQNMEVILEILWNAKAIKSLEVKLKGTNFSPEAITDLLASIGVNFGLRCLSLDFTESEGITDEVLGVISKTLTTLENLRCLNLNFRSCLDITNTGLTKLASSISLLTEIETLNLNLDGCYVIASNGFDNFAKSLLNLKNMITLEVSCQKLSRLGDEGIASLSQAIMTLKKLTHFDLSFAFGSVGDKGMNSLATNLKRLTSLTHLRLDFSNSDGITDYGITLLSQTLGSFSELQDLTLIFEGASNVSDIGLLHLSASIHKLKKLQKLFLSFDNNPTIGNIGLKEISKALIYLSQLQEMTCLFGNCNNITDEGISNLAGGISNLHKLNSIYLSFQGCDKITDNGIFKLSLALVDLTHLKKIVMDLEKCDGLGSKCIVQLFQSLSALPAVNSLALYLKECSKIDDESLEKLALYLPLFSALKHVTIQFDGCLSISDAGVVKFGQACTVIQGLSSLNLSFMWCNQITDYALSQLTMPLSQMKQLEELTLDFRMCAKISNNAAQAFLQELPKGDKITKILYF